MSPQMVSERLGWKDKQRGSRDNEVGFLKPAHPDQDSHSRDMMQMVRVANVALQVPSLSLEA